MYGDGLLICTQGSGALYYYEFGSDGVASEVLAPGSIPGNDGLEIITEDDGTSTLYVTQVTLSLVSVYRVADGDNGPEATFLGTLVSEDYDTPATSAIVGDLLYSVNSRFGLGFPAEGEDDPETFNEAFSVVAVNRFDYSSSGTVEPAPTLSPTMLPDTTETGSPTQPGPGPPSSNTPVLHVVQPLLMGIVLVLALLM